MQSITPIVKNAQRLEKRANDILDVTRIENKQLKLNLERFNLVDLIADIVQDFKNNNNANVITSKETNCRVNSRRASTTDLRSCRRVYLCRSR